MWVVRCLIASVARTLDRYFSTIDRLGASVGEFVRLTERSAKKERSDDEGRVNFAAPPSICLTLVPQHSAYE